MLDSFKIVGCERIPRGTFFKKPFKNLRRDEGKRGDRHKFGDKRCDDVKDFLVMRELERRSGPRSKPKFQK